MSETQEGAGEKGASVTFPPPFVPLIALAVGLLVESFVVSSGFAPGALLRYGGGGLLIGVGTGVMWAAAGLFRKTGQDPKPWEPSPELIVEGIYRFTRNPMYLGFGLIQAGIGIASGSLWPLVLVPVSWGVIYVIAIRHEEAYLRERFGEPYEAYLRDVRRWI